MEFAEEGETDLGDLVLDRGLTALVQLNDAVTGKPYGLPSNYSELSARINRPGSQGETLPSGGKPVDIKGTFRFICIDPRAEAIILRPRERQYVTIAPLPEPNAGGILDLGQHTVQAK